MAKRYKSKAGRRKRNKRMRKRGKYDKSYYALCRSTAFISCDTTSSAASMGVHWGSGGSSGTHDMYIDDCTEFAALVSFYQQWRLHGLKIKV